MPKLHKARSKAILALITTNLIWAAAIPIAKKAFNEGLTPTLFLQTRFTIAAIFSLPVLYYVFKTENIKKYFKSKTFLTIIALEFIGTFLGLSFLYKGVSYSSSIDTILLSSALPLFITAGGILFLREKETGNEFMGLFLSFLGSIILILKGGHFQINLQNPGNLLVIGHNITVASYYLLAKKYYKNINKFFISSIGFFVGGIAFSLASMTDPVSALYKVTTLGPWSIASVLYMAILGSIVALTFYLYGQDKIEASEAAIFNYLNPIFAIPLSFLLLSEMIGQKELVAGALILLGVFIAQRRKK